ncbi:MAG: creatininase family protein [Prolixibacteraceae bacterium]
MRSDLAENNWKTLKDEPVELVILPWGATEAHNYHLPYGTDNYQVEAISSEAVARANKEGARAVVLPGIPFGVNTGQTDIRLTINILPSTQYRILYDVIENLDRHGIRKLVIMNGHGGNDFKQQIRELNHHFPAMFISVSQWFKLPGKEEFFSEPGDHADESETSLMMYLKPELVLPLEEAGDGSFKKMKIDAFNQGWSWAERKWTKVTADTGIGNPKLATREKGKIYFEYLVKNYCDFFLELSRLDLNDMYR